MGTSEKDAQREYHRLMASEGLLPPVQAAQSTVPVVVEAFLAIKNSTRKNTLKSYTYYLTPFAAAFMSRKFGSLTASDVLKWVASRETWGETTRHNASNCAAAIFGGTGDAGFIERNVMAGIENCSVENLY